MKGDFSRFTYNPQNNYVSVLKQQGRVDLDSDWNEQAEYCRASGSGSWPRTSSESSQYPSAANDITRDNAGALAISSFSSGPGGVFDFNISKGLAYVYGHQFKLPKDATFRNQSDYPEPEAHSEAGDLLVFIELWRRSAGYIDDELIRNRRSAGQIPVFGPSS